MKIAIEPCALTGDALPRRHLARALLALSLGGGLGFVGPAQAATLKVFGPANYGGLLRLRAGVASGLLLNQLRRTEALSGDRFEVELTDWLRALRLAEQGQGGLLAVSRTPARERWLAFSKPCWYDQLRLVVRTDSPLDFREVADLKGLRVGMARGTTGGAAFDAAEAAGQLQTVRDALSAPQRLRALMAGRIDVAVVGDTYRDALAQVDPAREDKARRKNTALRLLPRPLLSDPLHLAFPIAMGAGEVLARFNQALARLGLPHDEAAAP